MSRITPAESTVGLGTRHPRTGGRRVVHITAWVLSVALGLAMAGAGAAKLFGDPAMLDLFATIGAGQWLRFVVGFFEVSCATLTNVAILHTNTTLSVLYAAVATVIFVLRRSELRSTLAQGPTK